MTRLEAERGVYPTLATAPAGLPVRAPARLPLSASNRVRRAFRHLHRMADPAAFMFDQPLSALSDLGVMPGTAASGLAAPRSLSALTEGTYADGEPNGLQPVGARGAGQPLSIGGPSVSAFSSPPPYGAMPAWHEDALNKPTRRERRWHR